ncbi:unnamed protein product [Trifolium pratense]|uniref:Uncharacterized protein n=1 Tax=Trifolium pratense TaxID=57577 RepID=A0ACB0KGF9_TRIPR|nr:unnamed protein product [Trifolium pratense]
MSVLNSHHFPIFVCRIYFCYVSINEVYELICVGDGIPRYWESNQELFYVPIVMYKIVSIVTVTYIVPIELS